VGESCQALYANGEALKSTIVTPMSMIFRVIARNFIVFLHNLVIYAAVLLYFGKPVGLSVALMLPGMLVLGIACAGAGTCLSFLCARFRDVEQMIASSLMILFFITPILWKPQLLPADSRILADGNFVYHLISLAREPLLGNVPSILSVQVSLVVAVLAVLAGLLAYAKFRGRLAYWL
jgi:ABC-type polysaccharide/polyol phosphate export permease